MCVGEKEPESQTDRQNERLSAPARPPGISVGAPGSASAATGCARGAAAPRAPRAPRAVPFRIRRVARRGFGNHPHLNPYHDGHCRLHAMQWFAGAGSLVIRALADLLQVVRLKRKRTRKASTAASLPACIQG